MNASNFYKFSRAAGWKFFPALRNSKGAKKQLLVPDNWPRPHLGDSLFRETATHRLETEKKWPFSLFVHRLRVRPSTTNWFRFWEKKSQKFLRFFTSCSREIGLKKANVALHLHFPSPTSCFSSNGNQLNATSNWFSNTFGSGFTHRDKKYIEQT